MDLPTFWNLIDEARGAVPGAVDPSRPSASENALKAVLRKLTDAEVRDFMVAYYKQLIRLNAWDVWAAGYVIAGGMSDDGFHYFRSWLIGKGRHAVELALTDPDGLGPFVDTVEVDNEGLEYVALEVLSERGIDDDPRGEDGIFADDDCTGECFDEETVYDRYSRLSKSFAS